MPDATQTPFQSAAEESQETEGQQEPEPEPEAKETVTVQGGRRRGKRKIMKKKTVKDEEGYLGKNMSLDQYRLLANANVSGKSRSRSQRGNPSQRMKQRHRLRRKQRLVHRGKRRDRGTSCRSFPRNESILLNVKIDSLSTSLVGGNILRCCSSSVRSKRGWQKLEREVASAQDDLQQSFLPSAPGAPS